MPTFTVLRDESVIEDTVFDVDPLMDTANPFGDYCVVKMDDRGGNKFAEYERGTRIDISVDPDDNTLTISSGETVTTDAGTTDSYSTVNNSGTYSNQGTVTAGTGTIDGRFTGYVVERRETEQSGADVLEVEAYSFDQFLRRNTVTNDQTGNLISEALADIIQTDTPVTFDAANVNVGDDQELTRSYQGEAVENVLRDLAFKSNNENFGVNDDLEFFFRPRETVHIDRGIDNTQWFNYDIPKLGKEAINEVEVWFDDGERSVIIDDGTDKLDLQDSLNLPSPGTQRAELNRPLITNINDAEDIGRKYLAFRNATLSGTVTTYGLFDAEPGDTIDITIDARGIDAEFVIAATEYRWGTDQTILTIVEKRGDVDDILTELNDSVQRQEMETANRDAPKNRITTTNATAIISITADGNIANTNVVTVESGETLTINSGETETATTVSNAGTVSNQGTFSNADGPDQDTMSDRLVNDGRRKIRDTWTGQTPPPDITTLVVGSDNSGLSRSNTSLLNQTNSATITQSLPDAKTVEFSASITQTGVQELGLETADGTLITRATFDQSVDLDEVTVTLTVSNDDSVSRGVLTNDGQTAVRDVLADNTPAIPTDYAFGSDDTPVAETDTALGNETVSQNLDEVLLGQLDSQSEWSGRVPDFADDVPLKVENGELQQAQTTQFTEAEDLLNFAGTVVTNSGGLSNDEGVELSIENDFVTFEFTPEYTIPADEFNADHYRRRDNFDGTVTIRINGTDVRTFTNNGVTDSEPTIAGSPAVSQELAGGESHTMTVELTSVTSGSYVVDTMQVADSGDRFGGFGVSRAGTFDSGTASFDAPELFPALQEVALDTFTTTRNIDEALVQSDWVDGDVSNNQYIELANDGTTFTRTNNSETASVTFASPERGVDVRLGLSRYTANSVTTPRVGDTSQKVTSLSVFANPQAIVTDNIGETLTRIVIPPNTIAGDTIREAGIKATGALLTRHILADFEVLADQRLASSETTRFTSDN